MPIWAGESSPQGSWPCWLLIWQHCVAAYLHKVSLAALLFQEIVALIPACCSQSSTDLNQQIVIDSHLPHCRCFKLHSIACSSIYGYMAIEVKLELAGTAPYMGPFWGSSVCRSCRWYSVASLLKPMSVSVQIVNFAWQNCNPDLQLQWLLRYFSWLPQPFFWAGQLSCMKHGGRDYQIHCRSLMTKGGLQVVDRLIVFARWSRWSIGTLRGMLGEIWRSSGDDVSSARSGDMILQAELYLHQKITVRYRMSNQYSLGLSLNQILALSGASAMHCHMVDLAELINSSCKHATSLCSFV